jgi:hypothetical protein
MPGGLAQQASASAGTLVGRGDRAEAVEIAAHVGEVLVGGEPARTLDDDVARGRRNRCGDLLLEAGQGRCGRTAALCRLLAPGRRARARGFEAGAEPAQIALGGLLVADRRLERLDRDRQAPAAGDQA